MTQLRALSATLPVFRFAANFFMILAMDPRGNSCSACAAERPDSTRMIIMIPTSSAKESLFKPPLTIDLAIAATARGVQLSLSNRPKQSSS